MIKFTAIITLVLAGFTILPAEENTKFPAERMAELDALI